MDTVVRLALALPLLLASRAALGSEPPGNDGTGSDADRALQLAWQSVFPRERSASDAERRALCRGRRFSLVDGYHLLDKHPGLDADEFWRVLADEHLEQCWLGSVLMIGLTGDVSDFRELETLLYWGGKGLITSSEYFIAERVPWAMALIAERTGASRDAAEIVDYLIDGTEPGAWERRGISWALYGLDVDNTERVLAAMSIQALALTRSPRALMFLDQLEPYGDIEDVVREAKAFATVYMELGVREAMEAAAEGGVVGGAIE